jgi:uncharacterized protein (DUF2267 family)
MVAQLPQEYEPLLQAAGIGRRRAPGEPYDVVLRVAELEGIGREEAAEHTRAVFAALRELVSGKELSDIGAQLPQEFAPLLASPS